MQCVTTLSNDYLNFCVGLKQEDSLYVVSEFFLSWMNPNLILKSLTIFYLLLPFILLRGIPKLNSFSNTKRYARMKFEILNFIFRISFGICISIILSTYFKQVHPCLCTVDGINYNYYGSTIYARKISLFLTQVPSYEVVTLTLVSGAFFEFSPYNPLV